MSYKWLDPPEDVKWYKQIKPFSGKFEADWLLSLKLLRENGYPGVGWITWNDLDTDITNFLHFENNRWRINFQEDKACFQEISKEEAMASIAKKEEGVNPYIGKYIEALVDKPNGGNVKKGEVGKIKEEYQTNRYIVSFPSQDGYYISKPDIDGIKFKFVDEVGYSEKSSYFIVGRWYKGFKNSKEIAAKFLKISNCGRYFYFSEYIRDDRGWKKYDGSWYNEPQIVECPIEEIQQYLPEGHPDKIEKEPEKSKFAPGDKVKINNWHFHPTKWKFPVYGEIVNICISPISSAPIGIKILGEDCIWRFKEEEIEHWKDSSPLQQHPSTVSEYTKEPSTSPKFKKGDKVICNYSFIREGWKGEVVGVYDDYCIVRRDINNIEYTIRKDCLDIITDTSLNIWQAKTAGAGVIPSMGIWQQVSDSPLIHFTPEIIEKEFNDYQQRIFESISKKPKDSSVFNEKEFASKPFNQLLTIKTKTKCKK